mmetsp:Transcript_39301/g.117513  ORF Transcript_39301/g.117513 Transcript_39301/m.117513 type:complete len:299 (+) Transcript_39301:82-978(+)
MVEAWQSVFVLLAACFVVPQIMKYVPDFDPLLMIVGLFGILALVQQLGFQVNGTEGETEHAGRRTGAGGQRKQEEPARAEEAGPRELCAEAARCLDQNNWSRAQTLARQATDLDPENARGWELLATAQKWDGKREEAAATVKKAQELYEIESEALRKLARELAEVQPSAAVAAECGAKGEEFFVKRQYDLAAECFTKALDALGEGGDATSSGTRLGLLRRRAECAQQLQDWGTCRRDATELLEADPSDARSLLQRAAANEALEKFKAALEDARKLLSIDPKSSAANRIVHNCNQALRD